MRPQSSPSRAPNRPHHPNNALEVLLPTQPRAPQPPRAWLINGVRVCAQHPACELTLQELRLRTGGKKRRFASDRLAAVADAPHALASAARPPLDTSALDVDGEACARTRHVVHLALVPSTPPLAIHNDLEAHRTMRLLSEVRHALRHGPPVAAHFMLFPSIHTFVGAHRDWCEALHAQMGLTTAMSLWVPVSIDVGRAAPCGCSNGALRELVLASSFHKWIDSIL
jgi:hypothetical protein